MPIEGAVDESDRTGSAEPALVIQDDCAKTLGAGASTSSICQCHRRLAHQQPDSLTRLRGLLARTSSTPHTSRTPPEDASHPVDRHDQEGGGCVQEERVH